MLVTFLGTSKRFNVTENLKFAGIYWEILLSTYSKVCSSLSTITELLGSLSLCFKLLKSKFGSSEVQRFNQTLVCEQTFHSTERKKVNREKDNINSLQKLFRYLDESLFHGLTKFIRLFNKDTQ